MLWNYQRVECEVIERVTLGSIRYWKVHLIIRLPYNLKTIEEYWVIVQPFHDSRVFLVNEMAKYFGLPAFDVVTTVHTRRRYCLIRSSNPNVYPEHTLRSYALLPGQEHNRTDALFDRVRVMVAFRRLMCVCSTTESCILVRKCGRTGKVLLYSLVHKFDAHDTTEIGMEMFRRWFVTKHDDGTESHTTLAQAMVELTKVEHPKSIDDDELEKYSEGINPIVEHLDELANRIDPSVVQHVSDVYHYLLSTQQSPSGRKRCGY